MLAWLRVSLCLLLTGCAGVFTDVERPEVSLAGLALEKPGLFEQEVRLDLRVRNPNDFDLEIERVLFDLEVNDDHLARGWTSAPFVVPAFGDQVVPVNLVVPTSDLINSLVDFGARQKFDYRLKGEAKLSNAPLGSISFDRDGTLSLPELSNPGAPVTSE